MKLEGGETCRRHVIRAIVDMDIPVMAHIGLTPQSIHRMGGYKVQGKTDEQAERLIADARAVEAAGAFAVVLEGIPQKLAARITAELAIPTIGIGAGPPLRRPGARDSRYSRAVREILPQIRQEVCWSCGRS